MIRIIAPVLLTVLLAACSFAPPSSLISTLTAENERPVKPVRRELRSEPQPAQEAGIGSSISSLWDSVKSGLSFSNKTEQRAVSSAAPEGVDAQQALQLVNAYRSQKGLKPLRLSAKLESAALAHSKDLAKADRISHYGSDGSDTWDRVHRTGYDARLTAENVGTGQRSLTEVFRGWQNSPDHNANILLADAEEMGIAVVYEPQTQFKTFWTMVIGSPASSNTVRVSRQ